LNLYGRRPGACARSARLFSMPMGRAQWILPSPAQRLLRNVAEGACLILPSLSLSLGLAYEATTFLQRRLRGGLPVLRWTLAASLRPPTLYPRPASAARKPATPPAQHPTSSRIFAWLNQVRG
jgi:hypothetical protein